MPRPSWPSRPRWEDYCRGDLLQVGSALIYPSGHVIPVCSSFFFEQAVYPQGRFRPGCCCRQKPKGQKKARLSYWSLNIILRLLILLPALIRLKKVNKAYAARSRVDNGHKGREGREKAKGAFFRGLHFRRSAARPLLLARVGIIHF